MTVAQAVGWWRTLIAHRPVQLDAAQPPACPLCGVRKCWPWADAFANLVATDQWHLGPPPTLDRPQSAAGSK